MLLTATAKVFKFEHSVMSSLWIVTIFDNFKLSGFFSRTTNLPFIETDCISFLVLVFISYWHRGYMEIYYIYISAMRFESTRHRHNSILSYLKCMDTCHFIYNVWRTKNILMIKKEILWGWRSENLKCKSSCAGIHNSLLIKITFSFLLYMCLRKHFFICKNSILKIFKYFKQKISTLNR